MGKVCKTCGVEIYSRDGENKCQECDTAQSVEKRQRAKRARSAKDQAMRDIGMVKVRGAMGGTYWE